MAFEIPFQILIIAHLPVYCDNDSDLFCEGLSRILQRKKVAMFCAEFFICIYIYLRILTHHNLMNCGLSDKIQLYNYW